MILEEITEAELRAELKRFLHLAQLCDLASYSTSRDIHHHTAAAIRRQLAERGLSMEV